MSNNHYLYKIDKYKPINIIKHIFLILIQYQFVLLIIKIDIGSLNFIIVTERIYYRYLYIERY